MSRLTVAICTYNRAERLPALVAALRAQASPIPFEILFVNNNSTDNTAEVLGTLAAEPGPPLRAVVETQQGIVPARNRAVEESLASDYLLVMDDDELPMPGWISAGLDALEREGADCAGGRVSVDFSPHGRPAWLSDELLGFLAEVDYGREPFWIKDVSTPVWTANVAYRMSIFRNDAALRFDRRFNREGKAIGGGEDVAMFETLVARNARIRYRPDMAVRHFVEPWRLRRRYFLKLHYRAGIRHALYGADAYPRAPFGVPPFMFALLAKQMWKTLLLYLKGDQAALRQAMNFTHEAGMIVGHALKWRREKKG
ncbi:MAG: glycosyltransferase [Pseudomonadota bacterium]